MAEKPNPQSISPLKEAIGGFGLVAGATYPLRAVALWSRSPGLLTYVWVPVLVNAVTGIALYVGLLLPGLAKIEAVAIGLRQWMQNLLANLPAWLSYLSITAVLLGWLLRVVLVGGLLVAIGLLLVQFGTILGAPWYGQLSEKIEEMRTGQLPTPHTGVGAMLVDIWRALMFEVKKLAFALGIGLILLLVNFLLPLIGTAIASIGGVAVAATLVCLDFLDGPLERRRLKFRTKLGMIFRCFPASGTFALVCLTLISVPVLNLLAVPLCVTAGTLFFCDRIWPTMNPQPPNSNNHPE